MDDDLRADGAVFADPLCVGHLQTDTAMGRGMSQQLERILLQAVVVPPGKQHGVEVDAVDHARGILHVHAAEFVPLLAVGVSARGHGEGSCRGGGAALACGAQPAMHHAVVRGTVDGGALVLDIHADPVLRCLVGLCRGGGEGEQAGQQDGGQHESQCAQSLHGKRSLMRAARMGRGALMISFILSEML